MIRDTENLEKHLVHFINKASRDFLYFLETEIKNEFNISITLDEWLILFYLIKQTSLNQQFFSNGILKDKTTVTRTLDSLEKKGFVIREINKNDKRNRLISLSNDGKKYYYKLLPKLNNLIELVIKDININDISICINTLDKISKNIESLKKNSF